MQYTYIGLIYLIIYSAVTRHDMKMLICEKMTHYSMFNTARYYRFGPTVPLAQKANTDRGTALCKWIRHNWTENLIQKGGS